MKLLPWNWQRLMSSPATITHHYHLPPLPTTITYHHHLPPLPATITCHHQVQAASKKTTHHSNSSCMFPPFCPSPASWPSVCLPLFLPRLSLPSPPPHSPLTPEPPQNFSGAHLAVGPPGIPHSIVFHNNRHAPHQDKTSKFLILSLSEL